MFDLSDHALTTISAWAEVAILLFMVWEAYGPRLDAGPMTNHKREGFWSTNRTLILAICGLAIVAFLHLRSDSTFPNRSVTSIAILLILGAAIGAALLRGHSMYRSLHPGENSPSAALPPEPRSDAIFQPIVATSPPTLQAGLYVCDIRFTFDGLQNDRHSELQMRVFNGSGRVVEFSNLSGQITFNTTNNTDPARMGTLPAPSLRSDTVRVAHPLEEWILHFDQRVSPIEADKLLIMRDSDNPIHFDLRGLNIGLFAQDDRIVERLKVWDGVSYSKENGFGQIVNGDIEPITL